MSRGAGDVGLEGGEDEFPGGGSVPRALVVVELPPQPAVASAISAIGTSHIVVVFSCRIALIPIRGRLWAVTDLDKHQLCPARRRRQTSTRSMPPLFARAT